MKNIFEIILYSITSLILGALIVFVSIGIYFTFNYLPWYATLLSFVVLAIFLFGDILIVNYLVEKIIKILQKYIK